MESLRSRLVAVKPVIHEIMAVSGAVGLSYGVVHQGDVVHVDSLGYSDKDRKLPVDSKTMFLTCSLTKGMVTSLLAELVEQGKLDWNAKVKDILHSFAPQSAQLREEATVIDLLSMRSGMERYNIWHQSDNRIAFEKRDSLRLTNSLTSATGLREQFAYNNWGYEVAGHIIKELSGKAWDDLLKQQIFDPLGLTRTDASGDRDAFDNFTKAYMVLDCGEAVQIPIAVQTGRTLMGAAGGVVSCVDDLLTLYGAMLEACIHQFENDVTSTPNNPFKQLATTMSAHTILPGASFRESTYGLGWIRTQLPNQMCKISPNLSMVGTAPFVGEGASPKLVISHLGSMPGSSAGVVLFPETESIIVVLINTTARCHLADWMTQLLTQTLFDFPEKHDYVDWVSRTVQAELQWHTRISEKMEKNRKPGTSPENLEEYVGTYANSAGTFTIEIRQNGNSLSIAFEGRDDEVFSMQHYQDDTFSWLQPRDDLIKRARIVGQDLSYYLIRFEKNGDKIDRLFWTHDNQISRGEQYDKV